MECQPGTGDLVPPNSGGTKFDIRMIPVKGSLDNQHT